MLNSDVSDISFVTNHKQSAFMDVPLRNLFMVSLRFASPTCSTSE